MEADKRKGLLATNTTMRQHKNENAIVVTVDELKNNKKTIKRIGGFNHSVCNYKNKEEKNL